MNTQSPCVVGLVTAKDKEEAQRIAKGLLLERLAACVNIVDSIQSLFWWEGRIDEAKEFLLVIKTQANLMEQVIKKVKSLHSYENPEIIALPIISGSGEYLAWIGNSVKTFL